GRRVARRRRGRRGGVVAPAPAAGAAAAQAWQRDRLAGLVHLQRLGPGFLLEPRLFLLNDHRLADVLDQAVGAAEVARRLPGSVFIENEIAVQEFLPLLHLSLENRAQIVLI